MYMRMLRGIYGIASRCYVYVGVKNCRDLQFPCSMGRQLSSVSVVNLFRREQQREAQ